MEEKFLKLSHINFQIGNRKILNDISFHVTKGAIHGFLGPNGSGKSTTMRVIAGVCSPISGQVLIGQKPMSVKNYDLKKKIGYLPENPPLYDHMTVKEYLNFMGSLRGLKGGQLTAAVNQCLVELDITYVKNRLLGNLSRGYRQRAGFAQAIIHRPPLIILDEPGLGLDPQAMAQMRELIKELSQKHTILLSSHHLHEVEKICSEVTLIHEGHILCSGEVSQLKNQENQGVQLLIRAYGVNEDLINKLRALSYINFIDVQEGQKEVDSLMELKIDCTQGEKSRLVSDLVRYGCTPIEVKILNNLERYFLKKVGES